MTLYLIPPVDATVKEVSNLCSKAGVEFVEVEALFDLWPFLSGGQIIVAAIDAANLAILNRHMSTLLKEVPVVVMAAPGATYRSDWNMIAHALPSEDWMTLSGKLAKSGLLASTTEQAEKRAGTEPLSPDTFAAASARLSGRPKPSVAPLDEETFDPESVDA